MIDLKLARDRPDEVRANYARRADPAVLSLFEEFLQVDAAWRQTRGEEDELRSQRNKVSAAINEAKKAGKDASELFAQAKAIPQRLATLEEERKALEARHRQIHLQLPNLLHDSVPAGKDDTENKAIKHWGEAKQPSFPLKPHGEIAEGLGGDFTRSAKIAGAGFYFLRGDLALLNRALIEFSIQQLVKKGFTYTEPPLMMRRDAYEGVTSLGDFETVQYGVEGEDLKLIATAEHPLVAQFMDEDMRHQDLPILLAGYSMCFRKEIGSKGVDTKGLFRTHQFNKVEQVVFCKPEDAEELHERIQRNGEELFEALGIPYRVVNVCTGDMGIVASKKYDTEAWMPRTGEYKEVCSASNCTDWQARRLNIRYQAEDGTLKHCYTLNNTAFATSRVLVAILENYQQPDGSVTVPEVLRPLLGGLTELKPKRFA